MKNNIFYYGHKILGVAMFIALIFVFNSAMAVGMGVIYSVATGAIVADEPVSVAQVKANSTIDRDYVSKKITEMRPAATPLDTILRSIENQVSVASFKTEFYAVSSRDLIDTVHIAFTRDTDGVESVDLAVHNISAWTDDDTVMMYGVNSGAVDAGYSDGLDLVCFVVSRNVSGGTIKVQPINGPEGLNSKVGKMVLPTIPIDTKLVRMGTCKNELDAQTAPYGIVPVKDYNYLQIFMAQAEEGTFQKLHEKEVEYSFSDYEAQNIYDMRARMEYSYLFGVRSKFYDVTNLKERFMTGGLTRYITTGLEYGTGGADRTIDNPTVINWTKSIFRGNSGSDRRVMFMGDSFAANMMGADTVQRQIDAKKTERVYGVTFNLVETNFGQLLCKHHNLLDLAGWGEKAIVLDLNYVEKHTWKPMAVRQLDLKGSGQRNVVATVIEETSGAVLRYPAVHAIIGPAA
jgi:hypothetical protein